MVSRIFSAADVPLHVALLQPRGMHQGRRRQKGYVEEKVRRIDDDYDDDHDGTTRLQQEDRTEAMISVPRTRLANRLQEISHGQEAEEPKHARIAREKARRRLKAQQRGGGRSRAGASQRPVTPGHARSGWPSTCDIVQEALTLRQLELDRERSGKIRGYFAKHLSKMEISALNDKPMKTGIVGMGSKRQKDLRALALAKHELNEEEHMAQRRNPTTVVWSPPTRPKSHAGLKPLRRSQSEGAGEGGNASDDDDGETGGEHRHDKDHVEPNGNNLFRRNNATEVNAHRNDWGSNDSPERERTRMMPPYVPNGRELKDSLAPSFSATAVRDPATKGAHMRRTASAGPTLSLVNSMPFLNDSPGAGRPHTTFHTVDTHFRGGTSRYVVGASNFHNLFSPLPTRARTAATDSRVLVRSSDERRARTAKPAAERGGRGAGNQRVSRRRRNNSNKKKKKKKMKKKGVVELPSALYSEKIVPRKVPARKIRSVRSHRRGVANTSAATADDDQDPAATSPLREVMTVNAFDTRLEHQQPSSKPSTAQSDFLGWDVSSSTGWTA